MDEPKAPHLSSLDAVLLVGMSGLLFLVLGSLAFPWGLWGIALVHFTAFAMPSLLLAILSTDGLGSIALTRPGSRSLLGAAIVGASMWLWVLVLVEPLLHELSSDEELRQLEAAFEIGEHSLLTVLLCLAVTPAICEELLHRGALYGAIRARFGPTPAVVLSGVLFAASHLSLARFAPTMIVGMSCALAVERSRSLWPAVVIHFLYNTGLLVFGAVDRAWAPVNLPHWVAIPAFAMSGLGLLVLWNQRNNKPPAARK